MYSASKAVLRMQIQSGGYTHLKRNALGRIFLIIIVKSTRQIDQLVGVTLIGVRDGGAGGQLPPQFGQFVDMNSGRESTLFGQNTIHV